MNALNSLSKGSVGVEVRELQRALTRAGFNTEADGWFGERTEAAVMLYQSEVGLVADGVAGPKTRAALAGGSVARQHLKQSDIFGAAELLGVSPAAVMAVNEVESAGSGFLTDGRPVILFERHVMYRLLAEAGEDADALAARYPNIINPKRGGYAGGPAEHGRLATAMQINPAIAQKAASWGKFQILGVNHQSCGFDTVEAFVAAMCTSEGEHLTAFIRFIEADPALHKALKARKWADFARIYNGPAYKENLYDTKLQRAFARFSAGGAREAEVA